MKQSNKGTVLLNTTPYIIIEIIVVIICIRDTKKDEPFSKTILVCARDSPVILWKFC